MRDPSCLNLIQNRCCNMISSQLYDRRALDTPPSLALVSTLAHLNYLTSASPPIREIVTQDGAIERLAKILEWTMTPQALEVLKNGMREGEGETAGLRTVSGSGAAAKGKEREKVTTTTTAAATDMEVDDTTTTTATAVQRQQDKVLYDGDEDLVDFLRPSTSTSAPPPPPQPTARRTLKHPHKPFRLLPSFTTPHSSSTSLSSSSSSSMSSSFSAAAAHSAHPPTQMHTTTPQSPYRPPLSLTPRIPTLNAVDALTLGSPGPITIAGAEEADSDVVDAAPVPVVVPVVPVPVTGTSSSSVTTGFVHPEWAKGHRELMYLRTMSLQCIVNVGVRGSETIRTRVVESGVLPVVTKVLESFMTHYDARRRADAERQSVLFKTYPINSSASAHSQSQHPTREYPMIRVNSVLARAAFDEARAFNAASLLQIQQAAAAAQARTQVQQVDIPAPRPRTVIPASASSSSLSVPAPPPSVPPSRTVTPDHVSSTSSSGEEAEMDEEPLDYDSAEGERERERALEKIVIDVLKNDQGAGEEDVDLANNGENEMQVDGVQGRHHHSRRSAVNEVPSVVGRRTSAAPHSIALTSPSATVVPSGTVMSNPAIADLATAFAIPVSASVPASGASTPTSDAEVLTIDSAASRHLYPYRPDIPEPVEDPFGCREEEVLMALQLLAYLSKYPTLRVAFHYPGAELRLFNQDPEKEMLPAEMRTEDVGVEWRTKMMEKEREKREKAGKPSLSALGAGGRETEVHGHGTHHHHHHHHSKSGRHGKHHHHHASDGTVVPPSSSSSSSVPMLPNVFSVVERFTHRPSPSSIHPGASRSLIPRIPEEVGYWAGVIMRNACRKDERSGGVRQCANMSCGKWETFPREFAKCRRCRKAKYCSKGCQSRAWSMGHKYWCSSKDVEIPLPIAQQQPAGTQGQAIPPTIQLGQRRMAMAVATAEGDASDGEDML